MTYYIAKICITALLVVLISEVAKRSTLAGAVLASIPLISVLAILWMYIETKNLEKITTLSFNVFWMVLPSLILFIVLPTLIKSGWGFFPSLAVGIAATVIGYFLVLFALGSLGR